MLPFDVYKGKKSRTLLQALVKFHDDHSEVVTEIRSKANAHYQESY